MVRDSVAEVVSTAANTNVLRPFLSNKALVNSSTLTRFDLKVQYQVICLLPKLPCLLELKVEFQSAVVRKEYYKRYGRSTLKMS